MALAAGTYLGPYEIVAPLGAGGMGEVYRARDSRLGREVAVKVLPEHLAKNPEALARFEREAKAVAALSHPNILAIHDFGNANGIAYAVMELLEGENLRARVGNAGLPWRKALEVGVAVAEGLSAAHAKGITHRDLKPENIFLTSDGRVKILDFGLARWKPPSPAAEETTVETETDPGTVLGTVGYMSPEQVRGQPVDAPSDIFSLGCVLYEALTGRRAFSKSTAADTMMAILNEEPPELPSSGKNLPPDIDRVILHCLEKNPQERFQSARDLAFALKAVLSGSGATRASAAPKRPKAIDSLAVLPFANTSGDPNVDYLAEGITESLINSLSQLPKLKVTARSTAFRYKGRDLDPETIGRELNVRALLMGRVVQRAEMLSIQADLVDVTDGSQLWGDRYLRKFAEILAIEEEIAQQISEKLRIKLTGEEKKRLAKRPTQNTEAYQLYLKGCYHWYKRSAEGIQKGIDYFRQAIEVDPGFALAYVGLSESYAVNAVYGLGRPDPARQRAAAAKAIELDSSLPEAHVAYGMACGDPREAEKGLKRAIELNPNYAWAHHYYAHILAGTGRAEEAIASAKRAQALEPLSLAINTGLAMHYYLAGRYDEAIAQCRRTLEIEPSFPWAHMYLGKTYLQRRMPDEAIGALRRAVEHAPGLTLAVGALGYGCAVTGRAEEARKLLGELEDLSRRRYVSPIDMAVIHAGLGENDRALERLEQAFVDYSGFFALFTLDPVYEGLRSEARFRDLMRRAGQAT